MLILVDASLLIVFGLLVLSFFRQSSWVARCLLLYLIVFTVLVVSGILTSMLGVMNQTWAYLGFHLLLVGGAGVIWLCRRHSGALNENWHWKQLSWRAIADAGIKFVLRYPDLCFFVLAIVAAYGLSFVLNLVVPPNNNDALSTHMSRVGYWYQHGNLLPWPTHRLTQIYYTFNAQLQHYWTVLFWGTDQLVGLVQWTAGLVSGLAIFGIARLLGAARKQALFAVLVWAAFPQILLQSTSAQDSLVATALVVSGVYFLLVAVWGRETTPLWFSGLALALAVGTKQVVLFFMPGLFLMAVLCFFVKGKTVRFSQPLRWRGLGTWAAAGTICFGLFSSYIYIQNMILFHNPMGTSEMVMDASPVLSDPESGLNSLKYNIPRLLYQSLDPTGIPYPWFRRFIAVKTMIAKPVFDAIGLDLEREIALSPGHHFTYSVFTIVPGLYDQVYEEQAWYGVLGFLLLMPVSIYQLGVGLRRWRSAPPVGVGVFLVGASFIVILALFRPGWDVYQGRYFLPVVTMMSPYLAFLLPAQNIYRGPGAVKNWLALALRVFVIVVSAITMYTVHTFNASKPLREFRANMTDSVDVWTAPREDLITIPQRSLKPLLTLLNQKITTKNARLGVYFEGYLQDYMLFGEHFEHILIPIYPFDKLNDAEFLSDLHLDYLLVARQDNGYPSFAAKGVLLGEEAKFQLYQIVP